MRLNGATLWCSRLEPWPDMPSEQERQYEPPPEHSALGASLERGAFTEKFSHWQPLGVGGFGKVVKAWHIKDERWYAVKLIHTRLRATETVDDQACKEWSGPEVFNILCQARSPHLLRYFRRWTELPEDFPFEIVSQSASLGPSGGLGLGCAPSQNSFCTKSSFTNEPSVVSSCGFEWIENKDHETLGSDTCTTKLGTSSTAAPPSPPGGKQRHDVILAVQIEFCQGVALDRWLTDADLRHGMLANCIQSSLELFKQLIEALAEIHAHGIVHSDVKPENMFVSAADGRLKLFDFGLARLDWNSDGLGMSKKFGLRRCLWAPPTGGPEMHTALGTPGYAPPELCRPMSGSSGPSAAGSAGAPPAATRAADIFSAGVVLIELLQAAHSRGPPWSTRMERAMAMRNFREGRAELLPALRRAVPAWLRQLVARMMAIDPEARPSAAEVLSELTQGFRLRDQHNPYLGTFDWSKHLARLHTQPSAQHNPYVGFFVDHCPRVRDIP